MTAVSDPCNPSPCGPNSRCKQNNMQALCSCISGYIGAPPTCRPECVVSSDCPLNEACTNQRCRDPCPGSCGLNAICNVVNHNPLCSCRERMTGDPFIRCYPMRKNDENYSLTLFRVPNVRNIKNNRIYLNLKAERPPAPINPCQPSPCGPNAECQVVNDQPSCSCLREFTGSPPNCRPECVSNSECSNQLACINQKCRDPCTNACGVNAVCNVVSHTPMCACSNGYVGDPFTQCLPQQCKNRRRISVESFFHKRIKSRLTSFPIFLVDVQVSRPDPCSPSPCGANAICRVQQNSASCSCQNDYIGNPYEGCRPECTLSSDCPSNQACIRSKCRDPCPGTCGQNAQCYAVNHAATCSCFERYTGDPFVYCSPFREPRKITSETPSVTKKHLGSVDNTVPSFRTRT